MKSTIKLALATSACLMLQGCFGDHSFGPPSVYHVSISAADEVVISYRQLWGSALAEHYEFRYGAILVNADGQTEHRGVSAPLLAADCSDSPPTLGLCIPVTEERKEFQFHLTYVLPDGSRLDRDSEDPASQLVRTSSDGSVVWSRDRIYGDADAVREWKLLAVRGDTIVERLDVETGEPIWSVEGPKSLDD